MRPAEDRARWTRDAARCFESSRTYREIKELEEKKHPLRNADLLELRARSEKLSRRKPARHTRHTAITTCHAHVTVITGACTYCHPECITLWLDECALGTSPHTVG